jgi:hypothetical protein
MAPVRSGCGASSASARTCTRGRRRRRCRTCRWRTCRRSTAFGRSTPPRARRRAGCSPEGRSMGSRSPRQRRAGASPTNHTAPLIPARQLKDRSAQVGPARPLLHPLRYPRLARRSRPERAEIADYVAQSKAARGDASGRTRGAGAACEAGATGPPGTDSPPPRDKWDAGAAGAGACLPTDPEISPLLGGTSGRARVDPLDAAQPHTNAARSRHVG